jgi:chemotaxis protein methyltransferase CheR
MYQALPEIKKYISFRRLNLMDKWPVNGPFDVIFCRNVMIYFDKKTQAELVARFYDILSPGGYFFVGHSESLTWIDHSFRFVRPSIYQKA